MTVTHIIEGAGAPSSAPPSICAHYINTENGDHYLANGTASSSDWVRQLRVIPGNVPPTEALVAEAGTYYYDATNGYHYLAAPLDGDMYWERLPIAFEVDWSIDTVEIGSIDINSPGRFRGVVTVTNGIRFSGHASLLCNRALTTNNGSLFFAGSGTFRVEVIGPAPGSADTGYMVVIEDLQEYSAT